MKPDPIRRTSWNFDLDDDWDVEDERTLRAAATGAGLLFLLIATGVLRALFGGRL